MTPSRPKIHALVAIAAILAGLLAACAPTRPPVDLLAAASRSLAGARDADAQALAPAEYREAATRLDEARMAEHAEDYDAAARLADEADAAADLAKAKARLAKARTAVDRLQHDNAALQAELGSDAATEDQP